MAFIHKMILALVLVNLALVLAKPSNWQSEDTGLFRNGYYKRATDCGSSSENEGRYSRKCRSSCKTGEKRVSMSDDRCSNGEKCCQCHSQYRDCSVEN